jgi:hypothetical protein
VKKGGTVEKRNKGSTVQQCATTMATTTTSSNIKQQHQATSNKHSYLRRGPSQFRQRDLFPTRTSLADADWTIEKDTGRDGKGNNKNTNE